MKIARIQLGDRTCYGRIHTDHASITLLQGDPLAGDTLTDTDTTLPLSACTLLAPVQPAHVYAIGLNYAAHVDEFKHIDPTRANPEAPIAFLCADTAITGPGTPVTLTQPTHTIDYEAELVAVIGKPCRNVSVENALDHVLGYTCGNDISDRTYQNSDRQWLRAKSQPGYKPLGPWINTAITDPQTLRITSHLNGELRQNGTTDCMIFTIAQLIAHLSAFTTLQPGDVIYSGTPAGVGHLQPGDTITIEIENLGTLTNTIQ